jgi:hypothetical protein
MVAGRTVNEIYACKLGDFRNWHCFQGLSTDSYAASRGSDGVFTGAATHLGHPIFFREDCIEKVYPSPSGAHQIVTTAARGVQKGCWRSLVTVGETLYYKSRSDVCAYTGALPVSVSRALGDAAYDDARAGALGGLYCLSMRGADGAWALFTYDTDRGIWHKEDGTKALCFAQMDGQLYWIDEDTGKLWSNGGTGGVKEEPFPWSATSGVMGYALPEQKYLSRFVIRSEVPEGSAIELAIRYDDGPWLERGTYEGTGLRSFVLPVAPRRCDHLQLRLRGRGQVKIYSIAKYIQRGSDAVM